MPGGWVRLYLTFCDLGKILKYIFFVPSLFLSFFKYPEKKNTEILCLPIMIQSSTPTPGGSQPIPKKLGTKSAAGWCSCKVGFIYRGVDGISSSGGVYTYIDCQANGQNWHRSIISQGCAHYKIHK